MSTALTFARATLLVAASRDHRADHRLLVSRSRTAQHGIVWVPQHPAKTPIAVQVFSSCAEPRRAQYRCNAQSRVQSPPLRQPSPRRATQRGCRVIVTDDARALEIVAVAWC